jgi:hypothetical protein
MTIIGGIAHMERVEHDGVVYRLFKLLTTSPKGNYLSEFCFHPSK